MKTFINLSTVHYDEGDVVGALLAYSSIIPLGVMVAEIVAWILAESNKTSWISSSVLIGQLLNELINISIKVIIKEERPTFNGGCVNTSRSDYGMPSSHSQFMAFFTVVLFYLLPLSQRLERKRKQIPFLFETAFLRSGLLVLSVIVAYSRFYLGYHTKKQVIYGYIMGVCNGLSWIWIHNKFTVAFYKGKEL